MVRRSFVNSLRQAFLLVALLALALEYLATSWFRFPRLAHHVRPLSQAVYSMYLNTIGTSVTKMQVVY